MKRIILMMTALMIFSGASMKAQITDYYTGKTEIKGSCYDYKVTKNNTIIILGSNKNTKFHTAQFWPDGSPAGVEYTTYFAQFIDKTQALSAFKEVFSTDEFAILKSGKGLAIGIGYVVGANGDVIEVEFSFHYHPLLLSINPDKFYALEQKVKQKVKFRVQERAKVLGYIQGRANTIELNSL